MFDTGLSGLVLRIIIDYMWHSIMVSLQSKVKNRLWVLNECVERVPEDYEAAKQLLRYGLHGTDAKVVDTLGREKGPLPFIIKAKEDELEDDEKRKKKQRELEESLKFVRYCSSIVSWLTMAQARKSVHQRKHLI